MLVVIVVHDRHLRCRLAGFEDEAILEDYYSTGVHAVKMLCALDQAPARAFLSQQLPTEIVLHTETEHTT
jgi:hypothetical protein